MVGAQTKPTIDFVGAEASATTAVGLGDGDCSLLFGVTPIVAGTQVTLSSAVPNQGFGTMVVCYTVNFGRPGEVWMAQSNPATTLVVEEATADSISALSPSRMGANYLEAVTFTGAAQTLTTRVSLARSAGDCANPSKRYADTLFVGNPVSLASGVPNPGTYYPCYSVNNGTNWTFQTSSTAIVVVAASTTSITAINPAFIGAGTTPTLSLTGAVGTTDSSFYAFVTLASGDCSVGRVGVTPIPFNGADVALGQPIATGGTHVVCYTTDNSLWQRQEDLTFEVYSTRPNAFSNLVPAVIGSGVATTFSVDGDVPTPFAAYGFSTGACGSTGDAYDTAGTVSATLNTAGVYSLCYSVNEPGGTFSAQASAQVEVLTAAVNDVTSLGVTVIGTNTQPILEITLARGMRTPTTYVGFSTDDCMSSVLAVTRLDDVAMDDPVLSAPLPPANYTVCFSYSGSSGAWVSQTAVGDLMVVAAEPTSLTAISPSNVVTIGEKPSLWFEGLVATQTTRVALAVGSDCSLGTNRYAETAFPAAMVTELETAVVLPGKTFENMSVCYSVDDGANWVTQTQVYALATAPCADARECNACSSSPFCEWCLTGEYCAESAAASGCPVPDVIANDPQCPQLLSVTPLSGDASGNTVVTVDVSIMNVFNASTMNCFWNFGADDATTPLTETSLGSGVWTCPSPPRVGDSPAATVSVYHNQVRFATGIQFYIYYDCTTLSDDCNACVNGPSECQYCVETHTCSVQALCNDTSSDSCPRLLSIDPSAIEPTSELSPGDDTETVSLLGELFVSTGTYAVRFDLGEETTVWANDTTSRISETELRCNAPVGGEDGTSAAVTVYRDGIRFADDVGSLSFVLPDEVVTGEEGPATVVLVLIGVGLFLLLVVCILFVVWFFFRRGNDEISYLPPKLTPAEKRTIRFSALEVTSSYSKDLVTSLRPLLDLMEAADSTILWYVCRTARQTDMDRLANSLAAVFMGDGCVIDSINALISREMTVTVEAETLFRTNSFATKIFRFFSKVRFL